MQTQPAGEDLRKKKHWTEILKKKKKSCLNPVNRFLRTNTPSTDHISTLSAVTPQTSNFVIKGSWSKRGPSIKPYRVVPSHLVWALRVQGPWRLFWLPCWRQSCVQSKVRSFGGWESQMERMKILEEKLEITQGQEGLTASVAVGEDSVVQFFFGVSCVKQYLVWLSLSFWVGSAEVPITRRRWADCSGFPHPQESRSDHSHLKIDMRTERC